MDDKIQLVKTNFNKIKEIRTQVMFCFNALEIKLTKLKNTTTEFVKTNKHNIFVFGLDSFQFQGKLIDYEYSDMRKFYFALNNRMYCEYYKLYKLILQYAEEIIGTNKNIEMLKSQNIFPIYKDIEPFKQYNFETIEEIHKTIIILLNSLNDHIIAKETQLLLFQLKQRSGLNINNFVNTFDFDVIVIKQKGFLYLSYLEFFHNIHTKHFKRFSKKMKLMNDYLDEDIKFDEGMHTRDDDSSIKSSISSSSLESAVNSPTNTDNSSSTPIKSLFKSNVKKVMNSLKISQPVVSSLSEQNVTISLSEIDDSANINKMLDSLTSSFDSIIVDPEQIIEIINDNITESNEVHLETINGGMKAIITTDNHETIYAHVSENIDANYETINPPKDAENPTQFEAESDSDLDEKNDKDDNLEPKVNKKKRNRKKKK
jgi:hypothetical protein